MIDFDGLKQELSHQDIIDIIESILNHTIDYKESDEMLMLPTTCHNLDDDEASLKLYYYDNTRLFRCYTHCNSTFDIFELVKKMLDLRGLDTSTYSILNIIYNVHAFDVDGFAEDKYQPQAARYRRKNKVPKIKIYDEKALSSYVDIYPREWINDGISISSMRKYGIKFSVAQNQSIIPHRDKEGHLIGVRIRNFEELPLSRGEKYMPAKIDGEFYTHPLMYNLYGIDKNWRAIQTYKTAWIAEGEKSVLLADGWYGHNNIVVATCGNKINKFQINLLLRLGVQNIVICYDRMGNTKKEEDLYYMQLESMCKKYQNYANFSFIFDRKHVLPLKAAPFDMGKQVFEQLLKEKVVVR